MLRGIPYFFFKKYNVDFLGWGKIQAGELYSQEQSSHHCTLQVCWTQITEKLPRKCIFRQHFSKIGAYAYFYATALGFLLESLFPLPNQIDTFYDCRSAMIDQHNTTHLVLVPHNCTWGFKQLLSFWAYRGVHCRPIETVIVSSAVQKNTFL